MPPDRRAAPLPLTSVLRPHLSTFIRSCAAASMWAGSQLLTRLWKSASPQQQLLVAAKQGSVAGVAEALAAGAAVDSRYPATRETALIAAARGRTAGHAEVLRALLAAGACPHYTDGAGNTALHAAAGCGSESHALALLEAGAGADWRNHGGQTPLELAFQHGHITVVLVLLSFGADTAPLQARHGGSRWNAFCSAHAAAVQRAEFAFQCRLERQWQESAANRGGSAGSSNSSSSGSGSGGASTSRPGSGTGGSDGASTSSAAWAEWPAGPHEQPGAVAGVSRHDSLANLQAACALPLLAEQASIPSLAALQGVHRPLCLQTCAPFASARRLTLCWIIADVLLALDACVPMPPLRSSQGSSLAARCAWRRAAALHQLRQGRLMAAAACSSAAANWSIFWTQQICWCTTGGRCGGPS